MAELDLGRVVGDTGATPNITATATVNSTTGTPSVTVTQSGTAENPTIAFAFKNLKGDKGDTGETPSSLSHSITVNDPNGNTFTYNGSANVNIYKRCAVVLVPSSGWSANAGADGYYTNTVSTGVSFNTYSSIYISCIGSTRSTKATATQAAAFNLCDDFIFTDGTAVNSMTVKAKTKPTTDFYVLLDGEYYS